MHTHSHTHTEEQTLQVVKLPKPEMQISAYFFFLFGVIQGSQIMQIVYVVPVENITHVQEYRCITEPEVENTKYSWRKLDWSGLPDGVKAEGDRLYFLKMSSDLDGLYICEVMNKNGAAAGSLYRHLKDRHSEL